MTELDFDELDKAVNNLMADVGKTPDVPATSSSTIPTSSNVSSAPDADAKPAPEPVATKPTSSPLTTKRRGQFMDVIRPSSSSAKPTNLARHQGVTLSPVTSSTPSPTTTEAEPSQIEAPTTSSEVNDEPKNEWPDPIDIASETTQPGESSSIEDAIENSDTPLESPFLPDAKPEKRPLGGMQTTTDSVETLNTDQKTPEDSADAQTPPASAEVALPEELHTNLVAIEAESTGTPQPQESEPAPVATEAPLPAATTPVEPVADVAATNSTPEVPAGGAIAQQYKEEPSSGDQTNGSIYDTANYHKAIEAHATGGKKHSVLKWVMWTVLLIVLGVGGGAAAFMLTR